MFFLRVIHVELPSIIRIPRESFVRVGINLTWYWLLVVPHRATLQIAVRGWNVFFSKWFLSIYHRQSEFPVKTFEPCALRVPTSRMPAYFLTSLVLSHIRKSIRREAPRIRFEYHKLRAFFLPVYLSSTGARWRAVVPLRYHQRVSGRLLEGM